MNKINMLFILALVANLVFTQCTHGNDINRPQDISKTVIYSEDIKKEESSKIKETNDQKSADKREGPETEIDVVKESTQVIPSSKSLEEKVAPLIEEESAKDGEPGRSEPEIQKPNKVITTENKIEDRVIAEPIKEEVVSEPQAESNKEYKKPTESSNTQQIKEEPMQVVWNHQVWDDLLQRYVTSEGKVDYAAIKAKPTGLEAYVSDLKRMPPLPSWTANEEKAYWINVYNAFTVKLIVDNYPVKSITDLHGGKPWDVQWIQIGEKTYSLNDIEHKILRPKFNDARIHFAVNCAAKSCPKIWNRAWTKENIEEGLETLTKSFITNTAHNQIAQNKVSLSKIFEWYKGDFGDLITFLNKYSKTKISSNAKIAFNDYDWRLNS